MGYFETDAQVLAWFDSALVHATPRIRRSALGLLGHVDCMHRAGWLRRAESDVVADIAITAVFMSAALAVVGECAVDLFESDFAEALEQDDLEWEWEYHMVMAYGEVVQRGTLMVWTAGEDDRLARELALHKACCGRRDETLPATAIIIDKRVVNQFTRAARSRSEAALWRQRGRPRYRE